jgi:hypothetical protein
MNHALNGTYGTSYSSYRTRELSFRRCFVKGKSGDLQRGVAGCRSCRPYGVKNRGSSFRVCAEVTHVVLGFVSKFPLQILRFVSKLLIDIICEAACLNTITREVRNTGRFCKNYFFTELSETTRY